MDRDEVESRVEAAFTRLRGEYLQQGGWKYPGFLTEEDGFSYPGPLAWSEADYQYRFARLLEDQFPGCAIYLELPLRKRTRKDLDHLPPGAKGSAHIDIVVSCLSYLSGDAERDGDEFRGRCHEAFIEVKWFLKSYERWKFDHRRKFMDGVPRDLNRLSSYQAQDFCAVAALLLVIDAPWVVPFVDELRVPTNVDLLVLKPPKRQNAAP